MSVSPVILIRSQKGVEIVIFKTFKASKKQCTLINLVKITYWDRTIEYNLRLCVMKLGKFSLLKNHGFFWERCAKLKKKIKKSWGYCQELF